MSRVEDLLHEQFYRWQGTRRGGVWLSMKGKGLVIEEGRESRLWVWGLKGLYLF